MLELLKKRRSIRKFKAQKVEEEKIDTLVKAALLSPTSKGRRPWEFIVVTEKEIIEKLAASKDHGSAFLKDAPLAFVVLGNEEISDVWIEDVSIASIILQIMAESIGLGSCWIQIRERNHKPGVPAEDYVREALDIPRNLRVESIIAIGYSDEEKPPYHEENLLYNKIHVNGYAINS